jgi:DNA polymerase-3 subunit delta'
MPFTNVLGHGRVTALLRRAVARESVPPTLLLAGPAGVGKWRLGRALAEAVNCLSPVNGDACGTCRSCDRIARGLHVDVLAVEPDEGGRIKIDVIREVLGRCGFRPFEGRRRVVLIRDADAMTEEAQNALLKSLEEPPPATLFVLTSATPDALLPTVRSRTMRLVVGRLGADDIARILVQHDGRSETSARAVAMLADGSAGAALAVGSSDLAETRAAAEQLLLAAATPDLATRLNAAKNVIGTKPERTRQELAAVLRMASSLVRDVAVLHARSDRRLLANVDAADALDRLARRLTPAAARQAFGLIDEGLQALERNAGPKLVSEWLVSAL